MKPHDITALVEENQRLLRTLAEIEQQNASLANLYVASYQLNGTLDRRRVLEAIKEIVINLIGSEELVIWEIHGHSLVLVDSVGIDERQFRCLPLDEQGGAIGLTAATARRFVAGESDLTAGGAHEHLTACIPLTLDDAVIGMIGLFRLLPQKSGFAPGDLELFDLLTSHAAMALYCTRATAVIP